MDRMKNKIADRTKCLQVINLNYRFIYRSNIAQDIVVGKTNLKMVSAIRDHLRDMPDAKIEKEK